MTNIIKPKIDKLEYGFKVLSNGLKVLLIYDPDTNTSSAAMGVNIGSLAEQKDEEGLAHFCEHLILMASKKYPKENGYDEFLSKNGGDSNASTTDDRTIYYFTVDNEKLEEALDMFAQIFIEPLFNEGSIEREIQAVDNEFTGALNNDMKRFIQLKCSETKKDSVFNKFDAGNKTTLSLPDIRERLLKFYKKYYTSEIMSLCVYSNKKLDELLPFVENLFQLVPKIDNFKMPRYDEVKPYDETNLRYLYKIVPVKDVNQIYFEWYFPYCDDNYVNPLRYLSSSIGHEGSNTLTSSLNKDNLCSYLLAGFDDSSKTYSTFYISIVLTKKGLENYKEVILRTLKFIKIMQSKPINERYYNEVKITSKLAFDYRQKISPEDATEAYVSNLMDYPPEEVLVGGRLFREFNESIIKKYLDMLTLDNLNIYFSSKIFEKECNLTEKYYGTKYCKEKLKIDEKEIDSYKCEHIFDYPPENDFIPKKFDLLPPPEKIGKYPEKIKDNKNMEIWYLQDVIFNIPRTYLIVQFLTPDGICDFSEVKTRVVAILLNKIINVELGEFLYTAKSASVNVIFSFGINKSSIIFVGFSDSLKIGMKNIIEHVKNLNLNTDRCKETLEIEQKELIRKYKNIFLSQNYKVNIENMNNLMKEPYQNPEDIYNFFKEGKKINIEDIILYKNTILKNSKSKWLIQGNSTKEEILEIAEETYKILEIDINKEIIGKFPVNRPVVLKKNYNYVFRKKCSNPEEKNSSLISLYQTSLLSVKEIQYLKILGAFLEQKFYDQIRTKETLGYIVSLFPSSVLEYYTIINIVQSNSKTPEFCAARIRNFYKESYEKVKNISDEEFKTHVNSFILKASQKDDTLMEVFTRNYKEIINDTYNFDRVEKIIENLNKCNKEEFIKFFEKYFINEVAILDIEYLSEEHYEQNEKDLKEAKILEGENIKKRVYFDNIEDFKAFNCLGVVFNNPTVISSYN